MNRRVYAHGYPPSRGWLYVPLHLCPAHADLIERPVLFFSR